LDKKPHRKFDKAPLFCGSFHSQGAYLYPELPRSWQVLWNGRRTTPATQLVAFNFIGSFWLTLVGLLDFPELGWIEKANRDAMVAYFIMWGLFTLCMFFGTLKKNQALQFIFGSLRLSCSSCCRSGISPGLR